MENIKNLVLVSALIFVGGSIAALLVFVPDWGVKAQSTGVSVYVGDLCPNIDGVQNPIPDGMIIDENGDCVTPPPDQCLNIDGTQETIPDGMVQDANGNCYTPEPEPIDICPNLSGTQETIPIGYYLSDDGLCLRQTIPPQDVCPNLFGTQVAVPTGMINTEDGDCVDPPKDVCPNIPGTQTTLPDGMKINDDNGACYTPPPVMGPIGGPTPPTPRKVILKNVPDFLAPTVKILVDMVPESIKQAVKSVPPEVARSFPYFIFTALGMVAVTMIWQAIREAIAAKRLMTILAREKLIAEEKDNFIALSSHYLHTPLTVMRNGVDTIAALKEVPGEILSPLNNAILSLKERIDAILSDVESNKALSSIKAPYIPKNQLRTFNSPFFWVPVILSGCIVLFANFLLGVVGEVDLGIANLYGQTIVFGAASAMLYSSLRTKKLRARERVNTQRLIKHEYAIDAARNTFIQQSTTALREGLQEVENYRGVIAAAPSARFFNDGYQRFTNILAKFLLLSQVETGSSGAMVTFNMRDVVTSSLMQHQDKITEKKLSITNGVGDLEVLQNRMLFGFVLSSVIDNAIKFSKEGGTINISLTPDHPTMRVIVEDSGIGVPEEKLPHLFKPFSRAGNALNFDYEGLGFSLFLDKIIMDYLGGDITADSEVDKGTVVTVTA